MDMGNYIILEKRKYKRQISKLIKSLNMHQCLKNSRTSVWKNQDLQISIDKYLIRILVYNISDFPYYVKMLNTQYGEYYEKKYQKRNN